MRLVTFRLVEGKKTKEKITMKNIDSHVVRDAYMISQRNQLQNSPHFEIE